MTTNQYTQIAVLAAVRCAPSAEVLLAVAAGLSRMPVEPWSEWSGVPTQHPSSPQSSRSGVSVSLPLPARPARLALAAYSTSWS